MINILHGLGQRMLNLGYGTPFITIPRTFSFQSLSQAKAHISMAGERISTAGLPSNFTPLVFSFTGDGNVSTGAMEIFECLPHEYVSIKYLQENWSRLSHNKVYGVKVSPESYLVNNKGKFDFQEYLEHGKKKYESNFHHEVLPYTSVLVNGAYWDERYPVLISNRHLRALESQSNLRLLGVADISCDISGPMEFMDHATTIDQPFYIFDPLTRMQTNDMNGKGFMVCSVDNLPAELPMEASLHFSSKLTGMLKEYALSKTQKIVDKAKITSKGTLVSPHEHLQAHVSNLGHVSGNSRRKRILLLGSGRVTAPFVDYFMRTDEYEITIASNNYQESVQLANGRSNCKLTTLDVDDEGGLCKLVSDHDISVSFVPAMLHPRVAKACIKAGKNMLTASYKSPEMADLNSAAKDAGITILNELGLDPGIDHLLAMDFIDKAKSSGSKITKFISCCGGLPAPENSANPLGYKFSWSPRGVLTASMNPAKYLWDDRSFDLKSGEILDVAWGTDVIRGYNFEVLPNRDSMKYVDIYGLSRDDLQTMFRGTLRYKGFAEIMRIFRDIGLLNANEPMRANDWGEYLSQFLKKGRDLQKYLAKFAQEIHGYDEAACSRLIDAFTWFGMFGRTKISDKTTNLDSLCELMQQKLSYEPSERDMVCLYHDFEVLTKHGKKKRHLISMVQYGDPKGYSAMAKTVGIPAAIGTDLILNGKIDIKGVIVPTMKQVYAPILKQLEQEGISHNET